MCRKLALVATALTLAGAPALAAPMGGAAPMASQPASVQQAAARPAPPQPPPEPPRKASPQERAEAERLDDLGRYAFWSREFSVDPRDTEAGIKLSKSLRGLGRFDEAGAAADQVLVLEPANLEALLESARARIGANQGFYAIPFAQRAQAVAPRDWRPVTLLAVAFEQAERNDEALAAHQKALALAPDNPAVLTNLGMFYAAHGQPAQAEPLLRRAASLPGATAQERQNLALVLGLEGRFDEAERLARQDLPPAQVDNNLNYLRASATPSTPRSWQGVGAAQ